MEPVDKFVMWHNRLLVSNKKLKFMSKDPRYRERGFKLDVSDRSFNRNVCLDCSEANAKRVVSHREVDRSNRKMGQYWAVDTSGPYSPAIITGAMFKTVFIELVCRLMVSFYHVSNDEKSILEIIRKFDDEILGLVKAKGILPIFLNQIMEVSSRIKLKCFVYKRGLYKDLLRRIIVQAMGMLNVH